MLHATTQSAEEQLIPNKKWSTYKIIIAYFMYSVKFKHFLFVLSQISLYKAIFNV